MGNIWGIYGEHMGNIWKYRKNTMPIYGTRMRNPCAKLTPSLSTIETQFMPFLSTYNSFGGFLSHGCTPSHHLFLDGIFPKKKKNIHFWVPPIFRKPPFLQWPAVGWSVQPTGTNSSNLFGVELLGRDSEKMWKTHIPIPWRIHVCMPWSWIHIYHQQKPEMFASIYHTYPNSYPYMDSMGIAIISQWDIINHVHHANPDDFSPSYHPHKQRIHPAR